MNITERMTYGGAPYQRHSETSRAAADAIEPRRGSDEYRVLAYLRDHGPATDEQIQTDLRLKESTERPRRVRLVEKKLVIAVGTSLTTSGRKATLWGTADELAQGRLV